MAKLTAPLLSFGARGKLANTLVYFPWKGIDAVRSYVIPANPNSGAQQTQRGHLTNAVEAWHEAGLQAVDKTAWNRLANTLSRPMSGFNAFCRSWIDFLVSAVTPQALADEASSDAGVGNVDFQIENDPDALDFCDVQWGFSPTSLINTNVLSNAAGTWTASVDTEAPGSRIFYKFVGSTTGPVIVAESGIYFLDLA